MGTSSDPYDGITKALSTAGAAVIFALGLFFAISNLVLLKDGDFQAMNNIITADASWAGQPALSFDLDKAAIATIVVGVLAMIAACLGCFGALLEDHSLICTYFLAIVVLGLWFFFALITVLNFNSILVPIADRQATQFCNVTQFYTYKAELGCTFPASRSGGPCGADCANRVNLLKEMNGCELLRTMCHSYAWESVGAGLCLVEEAVPPMWQSSQQTSAACKQACNEHVACSAASYDVATKACSLVMGLQPTTNDTWIKLEPATSAKTTTATSPVFSSDGQVGSFCDKKDKPVVVTKAQSVSLIAAWLSVLATVMTCVAMCCTCSLLYTISTRRKGKKGACPLLQKMLCPCCVSTDKRRFEDDDEFAAVDSDSSEYLS